MTLQQFIAIFILTASSLCASGWTYNLEIAQFDKAGENSIYLCPYTSPRRNNARH